MTDASSTQLPVTANFLNPQTLDHPAGYTHVVEVTAGRPVYIASQGVAPSSGAGPTPDSSTLVHRAGMYSLPRWKSGRRDREPPRWTLHIVRGMGPAVLQQDVGARVTTRPN
jgi:hypothetical protein